MTRRRILAMTVSRGRSERGNAGEDSEDGGKHGGGVEENENEEEDEGGEGDDLTARASMDRSGTVCTLTQFWVRCFSRRERSRAVRPCSRRPCCRYFLSLFIF